MELERLLKASIKGLFQTCRDLGPEGARIAGVVALRAAGRVLPVYMRGDDTGGYPRLVISYAQGFLDGAQPVEALLDVATAAADSLYEQGYGAFSDETACRTGAGDAAVEAAQALAYGSVSYAVESTDSAGRCLEEEECGERLAQYLDFRELLGEERWSDTNQQGSYREP